MPLGYVCVSDSESVPLSLHLVENLPSCYKHLNYDSGERGLDAASYGKKKSRRRGGEGVFKRFKAVFNWSPEIFAHDNSDFEMLLILDINILSIYSPFQF
jgi:hypothetical protein